MRNLFLALLLTLLSVGSAWADWLGDKYSLFIHYGLYSVAGGVWQGTPVKRGYSEQILTFGVGFSDEYEALTEQFHAKDFSAQEIVQLAQRAGMRSIVITSKHHDGFCLWRTATTPYNSYDATPARRDLVGEIAAACHQAGLGFGLYFSLIDWHYPYAMPFSSHNADPITPLHHEYNLKQVRELLTQYGAVDELWFDMGSMQQSQSREMYQLVHSLQPQCMVSGRLGNDFADFCVMADNEYPDYSMVMPWQTAASIFDETWGYRSWQERGKVEDKVQEKLQSLLSVISGGGKYLLNIGPMGSGKIVDFEREVLQRIGDWIAPIQQAIYQTQPSPWGVRKELPLATVAPDGKILYLFVPYNREGKDIVLPPIEGKMLRIQTLRGKGKTTHPKQEKGVISFSLEGAAPEDYYTVLALHFDCPLSLVTPPHNTKRLYPLEAEALYAHSQIDYYTGYRSIVGYRWYPQHGKQKATLSFTKEEKGKNIQLNIAGEKQEIALLSADSSLYTTPLKALHWQQLLVASSGGRFGTLPAKFTQKDEFNPEQWRTLPVSFAYQEKVSQGSARYLHYTLTADRDLVLPLEIQFSEGMLCLVDGTIVAGAIYRPQESGRLHQHTLRLPLKKGSHTLLVKLYNRESRSMEAHITPLPQIQLWHKKIQLPAMQAPFTLEITKEMKPPFASPAHLYGIDLAL